jgi:hypothetical protein
MKIIQYILNDITAGQSIIQTKTHTNFKSTSHRRHVKCKPVAEVILTLQKKEKNTWLYMPYILKWSASLLVFFFFLLLDTQTTHIYEKEEVQSDQPSVLYSSYVIRRCAKMIQVFADVLK